MTPLSATSVAPARRGARRSKVPEVHGEIAQIAVVDPDDLGAGLERQLRLFFVVDLDERREADLDGQRDVPGKRSGVEERRYEQDGVGTGSGFDNLRLVHGEVFADDGERGGVARGVEVFEGAFKRSGSVRTEMQLAPSVS